MKFINIKNDKFTSQNKSPVKFISVGDSVTKNLTIYEYENDLIAVDFGIGFPEEDVYGVDFIIPDMTYLIENKDKIKGLFISHSHADHFAAVPYLLRQLNIPIYANKLTQAYIRDLLEEKNFKDLKDKVSFHLFDETTGIVDLGNFKISAFGVNHSVPNSLGIAIETPEGTFLHMADFKVDMTPVIDKPIDLAKISEYGNKGVLCLVSDCLGAKTEGFIKSESSLNETFPILFEEFPNKQLFITTISSNISRMHQIISAAIKADRLVVPAGRSIDQSIRIGRNLGFLPFKEDAFVDIKKAKDLPQDSIVYIIAGCFGQPGSALDRLGMGENNDISLEKGAIVVFSSEPNPPGVDIDVDRVSSNLIVAGAEVIDHTTRANLHVSGHGHIGDLSLIASLVKPKYFIPIGGTPIQTHAYKNMIKNMGLNSNNVFELPEGQIVEFANQNASFGQKIEIQDIYIDGVGLSPVVIKDRELLSTDGVFVVVIPISSQTKQIVGKVDVITRGFVYVKESKALLGMSRDVATKVLERNGKNISDWGDIKNKIEKEMQRFLYKQTSRHPLIIVHSIFV